MTKQPEDWLDDVPGDDVEDEDDEIIWVSKSEIKRDAEELKRLGAELVDLGKNALDKIPLDTDLRDAIELAQRIKKRVAAASCSLSARCCATAMSIRFVRRWTS
ncbi:alpha helix protein [Klebsiella pneumoniae subsp. ozaenae]|uniref:Alpha helix protein n=1 Tax=Klebsiella pneumoniae subsp. ozaenae TaxID=574 RepID=A0A378AYH7_KLEPO|nr:alpha helix protein [Klebsiella pneumoniae subsp. ozaenae]